MTTNEEDDVKILFTNGIINKRQLKNLMYCTFHNYGVVKSSIIADKVKNLTFHYATKSGISLSIEDLRVPQKKRSLIGLTNNEGNCGGGQAMLQDGQPALGSGV